MSEAVYRIIELLCAMLASVAKGSNLALFHVLLAILSGRLLESRGAVVSALADLQLCNEAVRRAMACLWHGSFETDQLVSDLYGAEIKQHRWHPNEYEGWHPLAFDLTGFFRSRLTGCVGKHHHSCSQKSLPAMVY